MFHLQSHQLQIIEFYLLHRQQLHACFGDVVPPERILHFEIKSSAASVIL